MRKLAAVALLGVLAFASVARAQGDFDTYPIRRLAALVQEHDKPENAKIDFVVSADPFPSKTGAFVTGERRPLSKEKKEFIKLWFTTRNLPADRADQIANEYRFTEGETDYWLPVLKQLEPFIDKELKKDDAVVLYYFFMGGYSKTAREWVFVVEEFQKVGVKKT